MLMKPQEFVDLLGYFCDSYLGRVKDNPVKTQKILTFFEQRAGLLKKTTAPPDNPSATPALNQQLLDVREAAQLLNVSTTWIYQNYKTLPHVLIGTGPRPRVRFRRKALLAWTEQHQIDWRKKK